MEIPEDESVNKHDSVEMIDLVLEDPTVEPVLLSLVTDPKSVLVCHSDLIWSGHWSLYTSHRVTTLHLLYCSTVSTHGLVLRVNNLVHGSRLDSVTGGGLWYEDDGHPLVNVDLRSRQTNPTQFIEERLHGEESREVILGQRELDGFIGPSQDLPTTLAILHLQQSQWSY